jgi:hypothetical protein
MSLKFILVACAHFGSLPNHTSERKVPLAVDRVTDDAA